jgi:hypothetical protein
VMTPGSPSPALIGCLCDPVTNNFGVGGWQHYDGKGTRYVICDCCAIHGANAWNIPRNTLSGYTRPDDTLLVPVTVTRVRGGS